VRRPTRPTRPPAPGRLLVGLAAALALLPACGAGDGTDGSGTGGSGVDPSGGKPALRVVVTVSPLTSIVANVAGPGVEITGLVPEGVNSHTFEPPPSAARVLAEADVVFINGLGLEDPTEDLAEVTLGEDAEVVKLGDEVLPEDDWIHDVSFPEEGGRPNPHLWTNPPMVKAYAEVVRDTLAARHPAGADTYSANYEAFAARVDDLDEAMRAATDSIPEEGRTLLTYHDAYAYFAEHYGWTVVGAIQPSDFGEPSPREVAELIDQVRARGVPVVFGSEVFPSPVLEQISAETGAEYVDDLRDDDLPGEPGDPEHSWLGLMRLNYVTIVEALGGDATALRALDVSDVVPDRARYPR
jgi:ABC-type Zn uptake system ZnuABC Zn-binding protein ZnuA